MIADWKSGDCPRVTENPNQGGTDASAIEAGGMPGDIEVGFGMGQSIAPMNGNFNEGQMDQFNGMMNRPQASGIPENMDASFTPSGDAGNPTAGEGSLGVQDYPRRGLMRY